MLAYSFCNNQVPDIAGGEAFQHDRLRCHTLRVTKKLLVDEDSITRLAYMAKDLIKQKNYELAIALGLLSRRIA